MTDVYSPTECKWKPQWLVRQSKDWHECQQTDARRQYFESAISRQPSAHREAYETTREYDTSSISFTDLPGEIRNKIYGFACQPTYLQPYLDFHEVFTPPSDTAYRALLEVSPQVNAEVKSYVLGRAEVHFKSLACINHFTLDKTYFTAAFKGNVKHISIMLDLHDIDELLGRPLINGSKLLRDRAGVFDSDPQLRAQFWRRLVEIDVEWITLYCNVCSFDDEGRCYLWKKLQKIFGHGSILSRSKMLQVKLDCVPQWASLTILI